MSACGNIEYLIIYIYRESGAHSLIWQCHYNLGDLLLHNNQPNRALIIFEESLNYVNKTDKRLRADSLMQMAMVRYVCY